MSIPKETIDAILDVVHACDAAQLATVRADGYPETRHMANMMNRNATDLSLHFMTSRHSPKADQLAADDKCTLYYYDDATHHSVRLFGKMRMLADAAARRAHWMDEFKQFGYSGPDDPEFVVLEFKPTEYKYYDAAGLNTGKLR